MVPAIRKLFCTFLILITSTFGYAQTKNLSFDYLTTEDGMPENWVGALLQDQQGYIWIGTWNGLVRYDGYETKVYHFKSNFSKEVVFNNVSSLHQDQSGTLWVGTSNKGLFWHDKANDRFMPASLNNKYRQNPFAGYKITQMQEDKAGNLFFITAQNNGNGSQLGAYNPNTKDLQYFSKSQPGKGKLEATSFYTLLKDHQGQIWVGTDNGLHRYNGSKGNFTGFLTNSDGTNNNYVVLVYEAPSEPGILWVQNFKSKSGHNGFIRLDTRYNKVQYFKRPKNKTGLSSDTVWTFSEDHLNRLWIGTTNGLSLLNRKNGLITPYIPSDLPNTSVPFYNGLARQNSIIHIKADPRGNLWLISGKGLLYFNSETKVFNRYTAEENNTEGLQTELLTVPPLMDKAGTLWLGSFDRGLIRVDNRRSRFQFIKPAPGKPLSYPGGMVTGIAPGKEGVYWLATQKGLVRWNKSKNEFKLISLTTASEVNQPFTAVAVDQEGLVWYGNGTTGIYRYNPMTGAVKNFRHQPNDKNSLSHDVATELFVDSQGQLWVGTTGGGLCKYNKRSDSFSRYPFVNNPGYEKINSGSLDDSRVNLISEDRQGTLWVGTNLGGLNRFHPTTGTFASYLDPEKGFGFITAMYQDKAGRYWVGTYLGGLFLFDPKTGKTKRFTEQDGLLSNIVLDIKEDKSGHIWIASQRGLSKLNPQNQTFTLITKDNGLPETPFNKGSIKTPAGEFLLCSQNGIVVFHPDNIKPNPVPPVTILQTINYHNSNQKENKAGEKVVPIATQKEIELQHNQNRVTFNYVGLHYDNAALNKYAFKLEGSDIDWVPAGTQRAATYTNLEPGTYTFRVKAANADGIWDEKGTSINLIILPPWWQTWWAYAVYALLFALALRAFIVYRSRALRQENQELESKIVLRTTELSKANMELSTQRDQLSQTLSNLKATQTQLIQKEKMASLGELTAGIAHEIQNPLNFVNNFSEVSAELLDELEEEAQAGHTQDVLTISTDLKENLQKINHHGKRADSIVKNMLQHSHTSTGEKQLTDINALADEFLRLSYHGLRAKNKDFSASLITDLDSTIGKVEVVPQELGRVLLNLFNNAFYAIQQKKAQLNGQYQPEVKVSTCQHEGQVEIRIWDNGTGIPESVKDKIFQPFFTTKPTGQGTGLGLSLSYDIITKGHGGELKVETRIGEYSEFFIQLPVK